MEVFVGRDLCLIWCEVGTHETTASDPAQSQDLMG